MKRMFFAALLAVGCAHTQPEEMTVDQHRAEAQRHTAAAKQEEAQFQSGATMQMPSRTPFNEGSGDWVAYNPTEHHLDKADRELRAAAAHLASANRLETFEDAACAKIPKAERAACPLLASWVAQVQETRVGVNLVLKGTADGADIDRRLNCHLAYAHATGFDRPSCPLFVKGMTIRLAQAGVIELAGKDPDVARAIQAEARKLFTGAAPVSVR